MYVFSAQKEITDLFIQQTQTGNICINDTIMHYNGKKIIRQWQINASNIQVELADCVITNYFDLMGNVVYLTLTMVWCRRTKKIFHVS